MSTAWSNRSNGQEHSDQPAVVPVRKAEAAPPGGVVAAIEMETDGLRVRLSTDCPAELIRTILQELKS